MPEIKTDLHFINNRKIDFELVNIEEFESIMDIETDILSWEEKGYPISEMFSNAIESLENMQSNDFRHLWLVTNYSSTEIVGIYDTINRALNNCDNERDFTTLLRLKHLVYNPRLLIDVSEHNDNLKIQDVNKCSINTSINKLYDELTKYTQTDDVSVFYIAHTEDAKYNIIKSIKAIEDLFLDKSKSKVLEIIVGTDTDLETVLDKNRATVEDNGRISISYESGKTMSVSKLNKADLTNLALDNGE